METYPGQSHQAAFEPVGLRQVLGTPHLPWGGCVPPLSIYPLQAKSVRLSQNFLQCSGGTCPGVSHYRSRGTAGKERKPTPT